MVYVLLSIMWLKDVGFQKQTDAVLLRHLMRVTYYDVMTYKQEPIVPWPGSWPGGALNTSDPFRLFQMILPICPNIFTRNWLREKRVRCEASILNCD